ncbi:MAG: aldolase/citrate lyase family protein [Pirellulales bacterium]
MRPAKELLERVKRGELVTGLLATDHVWTDLVELSQRAGLDYLIVDMEHGPHGPELVSEVCTTGRRLNFPVFIRPRANDYANLRLAIDLGCCGFLLASVETAAELDVVRDAIHMPPRGRRRPGGVGNRWVENYRYPAWKETVEDHFLVLPQIETRLGLENRGAIAGHEVTSALAVGPYDLSAELGVCGVMDDPKLLAALGQLKQTAADAGKPMWMIGDAKSLVERGFNFLCIGEPSWMLVAAVKQALAEARGAAPPSPTGYAGK